MRLVGWPQQWDKREGVIPIDLLEVDFQASPDDLRALSAFFASAAELVEKGAREGSEVRAEIDFPNPHTFAGVPLSISVVHKKENS